MATWRGAFLALARKALPPSEVRAADLDDYNPATAGEQDHPGSAARLARSPHQEPHGARKEVWDRQLREWLNWPLAQAAPKRRLRGETALFLNPTARNTQKRWTVSGLEGEWKRACACAGVEYIPLQQGTPHSILAMLGQTLP